MLGRCARDISFSNMEEDVWKGDVGAEETEYKPKPEVQQSKEYGAEDERRETD